MDDNNLPVVHENWSPELDQFLSEQAIASRPFNKPRKASDKGRFVAAVGEAFDLIGGVPRFTLWADANPDKFYAICGKTIPGVISQTNIHASGPVTIISPIGRSALDEDPIEGEATEVLPTGD